MQLFELRRDFNELEKEKKTLKNEVDSLNQHVAHFKSKAQDWKTSSLMRQKHNIKLKADLETLTTRLQLPRVKTSAVAQCDQTNERTSLPSSEVVNPVVASSSTVLKEANKLRRSKELDLDKSPPKSHKVRKVSPAQVRYF